jgi:hypothetical protein
MLYTFFRLNKKKLEPVTKKILTGTGIETLILYFQIPIPKS